MAENSRPPVIGYPVPPSRAYSSGYRAAASNTAYPCAAPPPQYNRYHHNGPQNPSDAASDRRSLLVIFALIIIIGSFLIIVVRVLNPRNPEFRVQSVKVTNFSVVDSQHVSGTWQVGLLATNPNKNTKISYGTMETTLFYKSELIAATRIPPLDQDSRDQTAVDTFFAADKAYVATSGVSNLNSERAKGTVEFRIRVVAGVRFCSGSCGSEHTHQLKVWCKDLVVGLSSSSSSNGTANLVGGERKCKVTEYS